MVVQSEMIASRLLSESNTQVYIGLTLLYIRQFVALYMGPVINGGISIVMNLIFPRSRDMGGEGQEGQEEKEVRVEEREKIKSSGEDKKSSKGSENDVYMLKTHGYQKHRFVSKGFVKRNGLNNAEE
ncbi:hypothetical protein B484DRAFT_425462 [Ochromonadaceae sp. CCMP2298]|nr:hypothetical protein B484DRAFT_425462 [Ochromonadaceae sp. CCMP2298]|mmetsp:Transcript_8017/g.17419  ORF Transcript_8017/g.17419 Transcript_8017/m.17419 type:complete len:127 (+) Transcript_8017:113-493(+)